MQLVSSDGTRLGANLQPGSGTGFVVVGGATAVPQRYYRRIAEWLTEATGASVLTLDYRGIGESKHASLRGYQATYRDWARDLASGIEWAADRGPTVVVGHSFCAHAFGMTPAHARTRGAYVFAGGAGWHGWMTRGEALKVWAMWNVIGPPMVAWHGYLPSRQLGLGENLPRGVYQDWRRWCRYPNYFFDDPTAEFTGEFARVEAPVVAVNSVDDAWAPPASAQAFFAHYPNHQLVTVRPSDVGGDAIGHLDYVRPRCRALWPALGDWVQDRLAAA